LNEQYNNLLIIWKNFGSSISKLSISQNTQNPNGIQSVKENLIVIDSQRVSKTGENLEMLSRRPNICFLISKSKKL